MIHLTPALLLLLLCEHFAILQVHWRAGAALRWQGDAVGPLFLRRHLLLLLLLHCRFTGEQALHPGGQEMLADEIRVVQTTPPGPKCPQGVCQAPGIVA
jgi:hypothetical protein